MKYWKTILPAMMLISICSWSNAFAQAGETPCASKIQIGKSYIWDTADLSGKVLNSGKMRVAAMGADRYVEMVQTSPAGVSVKLYGVIIGPNIVLINTKYQEAWVGTCRVDEINGNLTQGAGSKVKKYLFRITSR